MENERIEYLLKSQATELAILFHNTYEKLAPSFGYETRLDTKLFDTSTPNGKLMIAVCKEIIKWQQERSYSEEEVLEIVSNCDGSISQAKKWFKQFKKK